MALDLTRFLGVGFLGGLEGGLQALGFLHQDQFPILQFTNVFLRCLDFVTQGGEFLVFPGLQLLVLVPRDLVLLRLDLDLELLALDLDLPLPALRPLEAIIDGLEFALPCRLLSRQGGDLGKHCAEFLVPLLEGQEFFDVRKHGGLVGEMLVRGLSATGRTGSCQRSFLRR